MKELQDRINRVINLPIFEQVLSDFGFTIADFQSDWKEYGEFESLPTAYQLAIEEAEETL